MQIIWGGLIELVTDKRNLRGPSCTVEISLDKTVFMELPMYPNPPLPRAGAEYWLVDAETFQRLLPEVDL